MINNTGESNPQSANRQDTPSPVEIPVSGNDISLHQSAVYGTGSVDLDSRVDLADEGVGGVESNRAGHQPESEDHQSGVAEVEQRRNELRDLELDRQSTTHHAASVEHALTHSDANTTQWAPSPKRWPTVNIVGLCCSNS